MVGCFQGYLHFMPATETGFAEATWLKDSAGKEIHMGAYWGIKEKKWMKKIQIEGVEDNIILYPKLVDWDNDGDLDLLMGGRNGNVGLRINEGTKTEPKFSATPRVLKAAGEVINLGFTPSVEIADINGDGLNDLVSGNNEGTVTIYLNSGTKVAPLFTTPQTIKFDQKDANAPSKYCAVSVLDYNNDGKKDILISSSSKRGKNGIWVMYQK